VEGLTSAEQSEYFQRNMYVFYHISLVLIMSCPVSTHIHNMHF